MTNSQLPEAQWIDRFLNRLSARLPAISIADASAWAEDAWRIWGRDRTPEELRMLRIPTLEILGPLRQSAGRLAFVVVAAAAGACSSGDPGPLAGTWRMAGAMPMIVQFRNGETEALGIIEKVSYERKGNDVIVTYENGLMKGSAVRYTVTGPNSARSELGTLQRLR